MVVSDVRLSPSAGSFIRKHNEAFAIFAHERQKIFILLLAHRSITAGQQENGVMEIQRGVKQLLSYCMEDDTTRA